MPRLIYDDYRSTNTLNIAAALVMYQRARKLQDLIASDVSLSATLAGQQQEAYMVAINSLSLVDRRNAWFLLPVLVADHTREVG